MYVRTKTNATNKSTHFCRCNDVCNAPVGNSTYSTSASHRKRTNPKPNQK